LFSFTLRKVTSPRVAQFAPTFDFSGKIGEVANKRGKPPVWGDLREGCGMTESRSPPPEPRVENQAGERKGVAVLPLSESHLPATPTE